MTHVFIVEQEFEKDDEDGDPTNLDDIQEWKRKDCKARGYILKTTKKTEQEILVDCTTANQMWNLLTAQHRERSADLLARFYDYKYKVGASMKNHIADIKSIAHQLKDIGRPVDDREIMTKIISTLPVIYRPFVSSWRHVPLGSQTLLSLTSLLMQEERENAKWTTASAQAGSVNNESALQVKSNNAASTSGRSQWTHQD